MAVSEHEAPSATARVVRRRRVRPLSSLRERLAPARKDAPSALFTGIRRRLTLQYLGVLAALLLIGGTLLYFGVRQALLGPVPGYLQDSAQQIALAWQRYPARDCSFVQAPGAFPISALQHVPYYACIGTAGRPAIGAVAPPEFFSPSLAQAALASKDGYASDTVIAGHGFGAIARYAVVVPDPDGTGPPLGVIQVGIPIQGSLDALNTLAISLLLVGLLTLGGAAGASIWLSGRAMAPAYLAFERQQSFIGDAAHELRTPLTLMRADAEVLLRGRERLDPADAELLEDIVAETAHMGALATNLLTLARLDAGATHIERDVVNLGEVAAQVVHRTQALAKEKRVAVTLVAQEPPALVVGDHALLEQAALILVDNAIKYNRPDGTVTVNVSTGDGRAKLEVRDTGIGIPPEHLDRLGERFYRVDKARSREQGGAGLGLSIARGLATAHGGTLTLASTPGEGTTATLSLPAAG